MNLNECFQQLLSKTEEVLSQQKFPSTKDKTEAIVTINIGNFSKLINDIVDMLQRNEINELDLHILRYHASEEILQKQQKSLAMETYQNGIPTMVQKEIVASINKLLILKQIIDDIIDVISIRSDSGEN